MANLLRILNSITGYMSVVLVLVLAGGILIEVAHVWRRR